MSDGATASARRADPPSEVRPGSLRPVPPPDVLAAGQVSAEALARALFAGTLGARRLGSYEDGAGFYRSEADRFCRAVEDAGLALVTRKELDALRAAGLLDDYQRHALRTAALAEDLGFRRTILGLGVAGEAGEVADLVKKEVGHGHPEDRDRMRAELGDVLWYVAALADAYGLALSEVAAHNTAKLTRRYGAGFSSEASITRVDEQ
ncbi:MAG: hypothetical protein C0498_01545 [Anaerolinea sp.]|nr:hypothetical protein [Anaerolinea sp.]